MVRPREAKRGIGFQTCSSPVDNENPLGTSLQIILL